MKPLGKAIRTANLENRPWQQELSKFLLQYQSTPHSKTKVLPAQLLYNRVLREKLPSLPRNAKVLNRHREEKENQDKTKEIGKKYADKRRDTKSSNIKVGDTVLVKQKKQNKLSTNFATTPYTVTTVKGTKVVAENENYRITRNMSFFKKIPYDIKSDEEEFMDMHDEGNKVIVQENHQQMRKQLAAGRQSTRRRVQTELFGNPIASSVIR